MGVSKIREASGSPQTEQVASPSSALRNKFGARDRRRTESCYSIDQPGSDVVNAASRLRERQGESATKCPSFIADGAAILHSCLALLLGCGLTNKESVAGFDAGQQRSEIGGCDKPVKESFFGFLVYVGFVGKRPVNAAAKVLYSLWYELGQRERPFGTRLELLVAGVLDFVEPATVVLGRLNGFDSCDGCLVQHFVCFFAGHDPVQHRSRGRHHKISSRVWRPTD